MSACSGCLRARSRKFHALASDCQRLLLPRFASCLGFSGSHFLPFAQPLLRNFEMLSVVKATCNSVSNIALVTRFVEALAECRFAHFVYVSGQTIFVDECR